MTTYRLPDEPDVDRVFLHDAENREIRVFRRDTGAYWRDEIDGTTYTWCDLLGEGTVSTEHPELEGLPPFPWFIEGDPQGVREESIASADLSTILTIVDRRAAELLVKLANQWAAQFQLSDKVERWAMEARAGGVND